MPETLDYRRPPEPMNDRRLERAACIIAAGALACFLLPFGLYYGVHWLLFPQSAEAAGFAVLGPVMLLWIASGLLSMAGFFLGVVALRRGRPRMRTIAAVSTSAILLLVQLAAVVAGFARTVRFGW